MHMTSRYIQLFGEKNFETKADYLIRHFTIQNVAVQQLFS